MKRKLFCFLLLATLQVPAYADEKLDIKALQEAHQKCQTLLTEGTFKKAKKCFDDLPDIPPVVIPKTEKPRQVEIKPKPTTPWGIPKTEKPRQVEIKPKPIKTPLQKCRDLAKSYASDDEVMKCFKGLLGESKTECEKTSVTGKQVSDPPFSSWSDEWKKPLP